MHWREEDLFPSSAMPMGVRRLLRRLWWINVLSQPLGFVQAAEDRLKGDTAAGGMLDPALITQVRVCSTLRIAWLFRNKNTQRCLDSQTGS